MEKYTAYGLVFESELDLKPLKPILFDTAESAVFVKRGTVSDKGIEGSSEQRVFAQISKTQVWLNIPDICRMQISNGNEILVDAYEDADEQSIRLYILGSGVGAILHQRGFLVLHANAILVEEGQNSGAVLFAGMSGSGKSTTAAVFHQRGFQVISDDVVAVDDKGKIFGGFPQIKLWEDTLDQLEIVKDKLSQIRLQVKKYSFPLPASKQTAQMPIKAIYFLSVANEQNPELFELVPLEGIAKFNHLKAHTYRRHIMEGLGLKPQHMALCGEISNRAHMAKVIRPNRRFNAPELVDFVIQDLVSNNILHFESGGSN